MSPCRSLTLCAIVALSGSSVGCSSTSSCSRDEDTIDVYGVVNEDRTAFSSLAPVSLLDAEGKPLSSAEIEALPPYTYFPANRIIKFHMGLVAIPTAINVYLSFSPYRDRTVAPAAGNQSLIRRYNQEEIVLRNDTCSEFWVWLTASTSATPFHQVTDGGVSEGIAGASGADATDTGDAAGAP